MKMNRLEKWMVNLPTNRKSGLKLVDELSSQIEEETIKNIADLGCGRGVITRYLAEKFKAEVTGVDVDEQELARARKENTDPRVNFLRADVRELPFEERQMDLVAVFGVLHHVPDWEKALKEIGRITRVGGYLIIAEIIYPEWVASVDETSSFRFGLYRLDTNKLAVILQDAGFVTLENRTRKRIVWHDFEAVYRKKWENAWSRY